jgi:hypothetical protein
MTSAELLAAARELLERPPGESIGGWSRAVALLTRQALEQAIDPFWAANPVTAGLPGATRKTQLACLPAYMEAGLARQVGYVWAALSGACHYHAYQLAPTATELSGWIDSVAAFLTAMDAA